jgi:hypothetical protein
MKTHDFAKQLESLAKFLRSLPNTEMEEALQQSLWVYGPESGEKSKVASKVASELPDGIEDRLVKMSPAEVEEFLNSDEELFTSSQLVVLAKRLGISTSKRQRKEALINAITRFYEAGQMDVMIRSTRKD